MIKKISNEHEIVIASYCIDELKGVLKRKFGISVDTAVDIAKKWGVDINGYNLARRLNNLKVVAEHLWCSNFNL